MLITEILSRNARMYGDETALIERIPSENRRQEITWQAFEDQANQVAHALIRRGIQKSDRIVHLMTNCIEWLPIYFGILRTGAWAVPLNFRFVAKTILRCCMTAGTSSNRSSFLMSPALSRSRTTPWTARGSTASC